MPSELLTRDTRPVSVQILLGLVLGLVGGVFFFFSDWGHGAALLIPAFGAAFFYTLSGIGLGALHPPRWLIAGVIPWPQWLMGGVLVIRAVTAWELPPGMGWTDLPVVLIPVTCALLGGYGGARLERRARMPTGTLRQRVVRALGLGFGGLFLFLLVVLVGQLW